VTPGAHPYTTPPMMRRLGLLILFASLCSVAGAAITVTDDTGAHIVLPGPATRIVSLTPGATEMLFAAGAGAHIVATVEYSDEPAAAKRIARIGDATAIDMERLIALHPDVVVIWPGGSNAAQIEKVSRLGIPLYRQEVDALEDLPKSVRRLGALAGTSAAADRNAQALEQRLNHLKHEYAGSRPLTVLIQAWNRPIYTVGGTQLMSDALRICGAQNVFGDLKTPGPAVDVEAVIARNPDVILAAAPAGEANAWLADWKRFADLRAVKSGRLIPFEVDSFSRLGPSVLDATEQLCKVLAAAR
jgi:iron complex transport system substrate-binding protein